MTKATLYIMIDTDGWYRIVTRNKQPLRASPGFDNLYRTLTGAMAGRRAIYRERREHR